jgi:hypothetical protein
MGQFPEPTGQPSSQAAFQHFAHHSSLTHPSFPSEQKQPLQLSTLQSPQLIGTAFDHWSLDQLRHEFDAADKLARKLLDLSWFGCLPIVEVLRLK